MGIFTRLISGQQIKDSAVKITYDRAQFFKNVKTAAKNGCFGILPALLLKGK